MTIPSLMNNYQRQSYVAQLHKVYIEMSHSFVQLLTEHNAVNLSEIGIARGQSLMLFMKEHFKVVKDCGIIHFPCFANSYRNINGRAYTLGTRGGDCVAIASGASICMFMDGLDTGTIMTDDYLGNIWVDVNGQKGPNVYGRDLFVMLFFQDVVIDEYSVNTNCRLNNSCGGFNSPQGKARKHV